MARSETQTKLSLDQFARYMGINLLHFNQVQVPSLIRTDGCNSVIFQHEWQDSDAIGREAIARAIAEAEADIEQYAGYRLLPSWEVEIGRAHV